MNWWATQQRKTPRILPLALAGTVVSLFLATAALFTVQNSQQALLSATLHSSAWSAYQAQLEYVSARAQMERAAATPSRNALDTLRLRLALLRSHLPLLYEAEGEPIPEAATSLKGRVQRAEHMVDLQLSSLSTLAPNTLATAREIDGWLNELDAVGRILQGVLTGALADHSEADRREQELMMVPAVLPLTLLFLSGACLVGILLLNSRRVRDHLLASNVAAATVGAMETNLRRVIEAVPASTIIIDPRDNTVSFVNPAAEALIGRPLNHPDWGRLISTAFEVARLAEDPLGTLRMTFAKQDGDIVCLRGTVCSVIFDGRAQSLLVLTDNTRLRDADLHLLEAAKIAMLGEVATAIAHELNQPLAVIRMAIANAHRMLLEGDRDAIAGKLDRVSRQVERAKGIIDQVRRYGLIPSDGAERFSLRHAIELAIGFVAEQYRTAGIRLVIDLEIPPELKVAGRQALFEQVIVILLVNAHDAFNEKTAGHKSSVWLRARRDGSEVVIEVEDDAGGISDEMLLRLFEPFSTSKPAGKRTGLGLSLARSVLRDMNGQISGGNIWAGACFTVTLPISPAELARDAA